MNKIFIIKQNKVISVTNGKEIHFPLLPYIITLNIKNKKVFNKEYLYFFSYKLIHKAVKEEKTIKQIYFKTKYRNFRKQI